MTEQSSRVVALRGALLPGVPVPEVVASLEGLLDRARRGEVRALAYAVANIDGTVGTGWEKPEDRPDGPARGECHALGAGILTLASRYGRACSGE
jgi:hypothetical protein